MKAIRTRYYGPTNIRGSKIIATDADRNSYTLAYPHELSSDNAHELAAYLLMRKMSWGCVLVGGGFQSDQFWVMLPRESGDKAGWVKFIDANPVVARYFEVR